MHAGMLYSYRTQPSSDAAQPSDHYGANVVTEDVLEAVLSSPSGLASVTLFSDSLFTGPEGLGHPADTRALALGQRLARLSRLPVPLQLKSIIELPGTISKLEFIFLASGSHFVNAANMRRSLHPLRFPVCSLLHSLVWPDFFTSYSYAASMAMPFDRLVLPSAAGIKAASRIFEIANEWTGSRWQAPKMIEIPYGIFPERFPAVDRTYSRKALGIDQDCFLVLCTGRLTNMHKADLEPLLLAIKNIRGRYPEIRLLIAGGDAYSYASHLIAFASDFGLADVLTVAPDFPGSAKHLYYAASDACVFPSDNVQETFGIAILEAMAARRPVVASDWSGYREIVVDNETGFLVPTLTFSADECFVPFLLAAAAFPSAEFFMAQRTLLDTTFLEQAIVNLMENPEKCKRMGDLGRRRVEQYYTWRIAADRLVQLWGEQWEECAYAATSSASTAAPGEEIKFDAFRHYASYDLSDAHCAVSLTANGRAAMTSEWKANEEVMPAATREIWRSVLAEVDKDGGAALNTLLESDDVRTGEAVIWLTKKGLLRLVVPPPIGKM
jgi:glycosyltransferase involved in cell wall biosynthesis